MANAAQLNLKLGIDISNLSRELGKVEKSLSKFGNSMKNIGTNLTQSLTVPIIGLGIASVKAFADMEKLEKGLTAIMGSSKLAKDEIVKLREVAKLPGLGLKEAVQGSINLQAVGLSAEEAKSTLMGFGTALAATGKGKVELEAIQYQLTQMISKNKLLSEDYKVIQSNLPLMAEGMRAAFGTSNIEAIRDTGIKAKDFVLQLSNALSLLPQTQNVTGGLANSFENLSDNIFISLNELGNTINETLKLEEVFTKVSDKIQIMVDKFKALSPAQQENIVKFALFAAAIGPIILVVGQLATSISSIIALTRTLLTLFSIAASATGIGALTLAVVGLGIAYYNTSDGQKTINYTGATLLKTFGYLKDVFSNIIKLLGHLTPLFNYLLKVVFDSINQIFKFFNLIYEIADVLDKAIEKFLGINQKQKGANNTNPVKNEMGFGGGSPGKQNNAGVTFTINKKQPKKPIIDPPLLPLPPKKLNQDAKLDKKLFAFDEYKTLNELQKAKDALNQAVITDVAPKLREQLGLTEDGLASMKNAANDVLAFGEKLKTNPPEMAKAFTEADAAAILLEEKMYRLGEATKALTIDLKQLIDNTLNDIAVGFGEQLGNALSGAKFEIKALLLPLADAIIQFGKMAIQAGITALAIKKALTLAQAPLAIAAGIALVAIGTAIKNGIATPKLAEGGLAFGPTMATVGDNRNAGVDPEVIAPLSKLKSMMGDMGMGGGVLETRISGNDLIILLNRSQKGLNRIQ
jgi:tape measure domain-containing protein